MKISINNLPGYRIWGLKLFELKKNYIILTLKFQCYRKIQCHSDNQIFLSDHLHDHKYEERFGGPWDRSFIIYLFSWMPLSHENL